MSESVVVAVRSHLPHPPATPDGLANRFRVGQVFDALSAGLEEISASGKIESMDCSEFPCLFLGTGFGTKAEAGFLRGSDALREYRGDTTAVFGWTEPDADGGVVQRFAIAVYPQPRAPDDETFQRLGARVKAVRDASR